MGMCESGTAHRRTPISYYLSCHTAVRNRPWTSLGPSGRSYLIDRLAGAYSLKIVRETCACALAKEILWLLQKCDASGGLSHARGIGPLKKT
jgi:hypothetical protein